MHASGDWVNAEGKPETIPVLQDNLPGIGCPIGVESDSFFKLRGS
ncbi:MAG: hypothetical protein NT154_45695 [Verrucomicrobia bacterium]|nr:hypothetical protein [Verrucomicrobiota bacterium]